MSFSFESKQDMIDEWHRSNETRIWCAKRGRLNDASYWNGRCSILSEVIQSDDGNTPDKMKPSWEIPPND